MKEKDIKMVKTMIRFFKTATAYLLAAVTGIMMVLSASGTALAATKGSDLMEVDFLDFGQSDCTLITCSGHTILIDSGDEFRSKILTDYLKDKGIEEIDLFVITHFHNDHCGSAAAVIEDFDIDKLFVSDFTVDSAFCRAVFEKAEEKGVIPQTPAAGETYMIGDMEVTVIAPAYDDYRTPNNSSLGMIIRYGDTSFLFAGDCEEEAESAIVYSGLDINADVYHVDHHGSMMASSEAFLEAVDPEYAVISCGDDNVFGHPHAETLEKLRERDIKVFRTDEQGTITAYSDGKDIFFNREPSDTWDPGVRLMDDDGSEELYFKYDGIPEDYTGEIYYIGNTSSMKFHYPYCECISSMAEKNIRDLGGYTREELIDMDWTPCPACCP